ncbi:hypothetical protein IB275_13600 [Pseudomonas sp. PDM21]|uniref:hypothetical protein n=1 Tax=unclassified Pseudomonas TaxID=196821 RepID=UPI0006D473C4|nr:MULTISPECIES: hypothetical protein [unclassified Pseudomonas]MBD9671612.1 hypothetical protein [Pseudomonas sp. PDM21]OBY90478.1 hypothetical protein A6723_019400 [Pseudomonas sp. AU11447]
MKYYVELTYPKALRLPVYGITLEAVSKSQAITEATIEAGREGYRGSPKKVTARQLQEAAA